MRIVARCDLPLTGLRDMRMPNRQQQIISSCKYLRFEGGHVCFERRVLPDSATRARDYFNWLYWQHIQHLPYQKASMAWGDGLTQATEVRHANNIQPTKTKTSLHSSHDKYSGGCYHCINCCSGGLTWQQVDSLRCVCKKLENHAKHRSAGVSARYAITHLFLNYLYG